jgi:DNA-binding LytR/AlgR family response regulator
MIFLDIRMPGMDGVTMARQQQSKSMVIFTTAHREHAIDSYECEALDYLMKPIKQDRFEKTIKRAMSLFSLKRQSIMNVSHQACNYFFIRSERKVIRLEMDEVLYVEGLRDYVILHTTTQKILTAMNIKTIGDQLPGDTFFRISKSFIINVNKIGAIENNSVLIGGNEIPIGNAYRGLFFEKHVYSKMLGKSSQA